MELHCIFYSQKFDAGYNVYRCLITNREIPLNKELKLIGQHEKGKTNDNVTHMEFSNCTIKKIPQNLMKCFSNLRVLKILNSELRQLSREDLDEFRNLERFICDYNEIEILPGDFFEGFKNLELISFRGNELKIIEPNILDGLERLQHVDFRDNPNYSKCFSILSSKDSNAELEDVKVQIIEKFFNLEFQIVQKFAKKLKNPMEQLNAYENMTKNAEVKLKIVKLRSQIFEERTNRKIEFLRNSESILNQEIKNFINFESKLIREINELRNFESKLTQEIQELRKMNSRQLLMRQQSEPVYSLNDNSSNVPVAALRQELQSWRHLANNLNQDVQKLKNSESKLSLEVQNLKISLQIENLKKLALGSDDELVEGSASNLALSKNFYNGQSNTKIEDETKDSSNSYEKFDELTSGANYGHKTDKTSFDSSIHNSSASHSQNSFLIDIKKYIQDEITKDFIIKIDDQEFLVHKLLVAARSATLADILNKNPFIDSLNLQNISIASFQHVLRFIYTDELPSEDEADFVDLFDAAGRLKIEELKNFAGKKILDKVNAANAIEIFN